MKKRLQIVCLALTGSVNLTHGPSPEDLSYDATRETVTITRCDRLAEGELEIPSTIENKTVTHIGEETFDEGHLLTNIILPNGLLSIRENSFAECLALKSIALPYLVIEIGTRGILDSQITRRVGMTRQLESTIPSIRNSLLMRLMRAMADEAYRRFPPSLTGSPCSGWKYFVLEKSQRQSLNDLKGSTELSCPYCTSKSLYSVSPHPYLPKGQMSSSSYRTTPATPIGNSWMTTSRQ